jgi:uncharacterized iron-regulated membrane protein
MFRYVHKWSGLLVGPVIIVWFLSGMVMMYAGHPGSHKTAHGRLEAMGPLTVLDVKLDFQEAWSAGGLTDTPEEVRLNALMGRPAYFFRSAGRSPVVVWADTGKKLGKVTREIAVQSASQYLNRQLSPVQITRLDSPDQWTVGTGVASWHWPLYRIRLDDSGGTLVYVSQQSAEVCQVVDRQQRLTAWLGSIPHWVYFTCLRQHREFWRQVVLWLAGAGTVSAGIGLIIGLRNFRWKGFGRGRYKRSSPFMGIRRLHHLTGLIFGITTLTWIFSGMLSLSPFHWCSSTRPSHAEILALAGGELFLPGFILHPVQAADACQSCMEVRMITPVMFNKLPYYLCWESPGRSLLVRADGPGHQAMPHFSPETVQQAAGNLVPADPPSLFSVLDTPDLYWSDHHQRLRFPVLRVVSGDSQHTRFYIDMHTGAIAAKYDWSARLNRWLYRFLHCFDTPFLVMHHRLRDILIWATLLGGTFLSATGLWSWMVSYRKRKKSASE